MTTTPTPADLAAKVAPAPVREPAAAPQSASEAAEEPTEPGAENGRESGSSGFPEAAREAISALRSESASRRERIRTLEAEIADRDAEIERLRTDREARNVADFARLSRLERPEVALALAGKSIADFADVEAGTLDVEAVRAFAEDAEREYSLTRSSSCAHCSSTPLGGFYLPEDGRPDQRDRAVSRGGSPAAIAEALRSG